MVERAALGVNAPNLLLDLSLYSNCFGASSLFTQEWAKIYRGVTPYVCASSVLSVPSLCPLWCALRSS